MHLFKLICCLFINFLATCNSLSAFLVFTTIKLQSLVQHINETGLAKLYRFWVLHRRREFRLLLVNYSISIGKCKQKN